MQNESACPERPDEDSSPPNGKKGRWRERQKADVLVVTLRCLSSDQINPFGPFKIFLLRWAKLTEQLTFLFELAMLIGGKGYRDRGFLLVIIDGPEFCDRVIHKCC